MKIIICCCLFLANHLFIWQRKKYNGVALNPLPKTVMQIKTHAPKFMQAMFILFDKHCLLQKNFTTRMLKYNVHKNYQP